MPTNEEKQQQLNILRSKNASSLPDNINASNLNSSVVKNKFSKGEEYLLSLTQDLEDEVDNLKDGTTIVEKAKKDKNGNEIDTTYETKTDATTKQNNLTNGTTVVKKAECDEDGNNVKNTYETKTDSLTHKNNTSNPHNVTKEQLGLGNVENKSSETILNEIDDDFIKEKLGYTPYNATNPNGYQNASEVESSINSMINNSKELFWCTTTGQNVTTFSQISQALNDGKLPVLIDSQSILYVFYGKEMITSTTSWEEYIFINISLTAKPYFNEKYIRSDNNNWVSRSRKYFVSYEQVVSNISNLTSNIEAIPNAKAVANYVDSAMSDIDVSDKQDKIDAQHPLSADLIEDGTTNKVVSQTEKNTWNAKSNFSGNYADLNGKPTIPEKTSDLQNDSGYLTQHQDISGKQDKIDTNNKLNADLVQNGNTNKVFTLSDKTKLDSVENGAEKNVQSDWDESNSSADSYIKNKPSLSLVAESGNYNDLNGKPTIPSTASQVHALPDTTKYGANIDLSLDTSNYVLTATLKDQDGNTIGTAKTVDFPIESVVVSGSYNNTSKKVVLTLKNNNTIEFSVADLVSGLQSEITVSNKLSYSLISGTPSLATVATSGNYNDLSNKPNIFSGNYNDLTNKPSLFSGNYNDLNGKPTIPTKTSDLTNDSNFVASSDLASVAFNGDYDDLINKPAIPEKTSDLTNDSDFVAMDDLSSVAFSGSYNDLLNKPSIPSGITEIATQYTRLTDLDSGVYKLTYNGQKYLYYNGTAGTTYSIINTSSRHCVLYVTKYGSGSPYYWYGYYFTYNGSSRLMYQFYTSESLGSGSTTSLNLGNVLTSIPSNYKTVPNSTYATYSSPIYNSNNTFGTSSYSLNLGAFANAGLYTFTIDANSSSTYGCPYTPSASRRACLVTIGDYNYSSSYGGYRAIQDFYCVDDDKHYQRYVTKNSYSYTFGAWRDMNASSGGGTQLYLHTLNNNSTNEQIKIVTTSGDLINYTSVGGYVITGTMINISSYYDGAGYVYYCCAGTCYQMGPSSNYLNALMYFDNDGGTYPIDLSSSGFTDTVTEL